MSMQDYSQNNVQHEKLDDETLTEIEQVLLSFITPKLHGLLIFFFQHLQQQTQGIKQISQVLSTDLQQVDVGIAALRNANAS